MYEIRKTFITAILTGAIAVTFIESDRKTPYEPIELKESSRGRVVIADTRTTLQMCQSRPVLAVFTEFSSENVEISCFKAVSNHS